MPETELNIAPSLTQVLDVLGYEIVGINHDNGWDVAIPSDWEQKYKIPAVIGLIHSEASEALEAFRHDDKANFIEEMGDTVIRILDLTHGLGMDIGTAITAKLAKNRTRGYRHGGKRV